MKKGLIFFVGVALIVLSFVVAFAATRTKADEEVTSPLYEVRVGQVSQQYAQIPNVVDDSEKQGTKGDVAPAFWSFNFVSGCLGSFCVLSGCATSYCLGSWCVFSACGGSVCAPSATCAESLCTASACYGSQCVGSGCAGSVCVGCGD